MEGEGILWLRIHGIWLTDYGFRFRESGLKPLHPVAGICHCLHIRLPARRQSHIPLILPGFQLYRLPDAAYDLHGFLNHCVTDGLEFLILFQWYPLREVIGIRPQHILPLLIPQVVQLLDSFICRQFCHYLVHDSLYIGFQVSVNLFPGGTGKPVTEAHQQGFHLGVAVASAIDLRHDLCHRLPPLLSELVTVLGLLLINMEHILLEYISCECGSHCIYTLIR